MNAETNLKKLKQIELWSFFRVRTNGITGFYCTSTAEGFLFSGGIFQPKNVLKSVHHQDARIFYFTKSPNCRV